MDTTVDEVFASFKGRRAALIKALTTDSDEFYRQCDPVKGDLCLFGYDNGQWEVKLPVEEVPPEFPEPILGITFSRDKMDVKDWLSMVAVHCDSWLLAWAFYFGARFDRADVLFDKADRQRLFTMINELPTIFEVLNGYAAQQSKEKPSVSESGSNEPKYEEGGDEFRTMCGVCRKGTSDEYRVHCDICNVWFHGMCVKILALIELFECPLCSNKRVLP